MLTPMLPSHSWMRSRYRFFAMLCVLTAALTLGMLSLAARPTMLFRDARQPQQSQDFKKSLQFKKDGTFQISIFEDLHFGENAWDSWGPQQDIKTVAVMNNVLDSESPELVVLNGDLITGENTFLENSTRYVDQIVSPLVSRGLTWASTYGNHDSAFNLSRRDILAREHRWPNARTAQMVSGNETGVSNYYLPVYGSNCTGTIYCAPALLLWFFDSRGGHRFQQLDANGEQIGLPNWVDDSVVYWYQLASMEIFLEHNKVIPSLAFVHIPTNASQALQTEAGIDPNHEPGINDDYILAQQAQGWCPDGSDDDSCEYGGQDVPFMRAIGSMRGLVAVFSGHDHGNSWCHKWDTHLPGMSMNGSGVDLCFGQHSGYGGYGTWTRGSRQVLVTESSLRNLEAETWIRLETQDVVGAVTLNATYGDDWYPTTPDTHSN